MVSASKTDQVAQAPASGVWGQRKALVGEVWRLALPVIFTNLLQSMVNVVDVFMVGRLVPFACWCW